MLGKFIWFKKTICEAPLWYAKSYQSHMMRYLKNLIHICCLSLHWALSNCCDPCENYFQAFMIKIHVRAISFVLHSFASQRCSIHLFHQIKTPRYVLVSLSKLFLQKRHGYEKNMDTWRSKLRTQVSEEWWMVAPQCDEWLTTLCGLTLSLVLQVQNAAWFALVQVKNNRERS